jgi:hypothetical protein
LKTTRHGTPFLLPEFLNCPNKPRLELAYLGGLRSGYFTGNRIRHIFFRPLFIKSLLSILLLWSGIARQSSSHTAFPAREDAASALPPRGGYSGYRDPSAPPLKTIDGGRSTFSRRLSFAALTEKTGKIYMTRNSIGSN